VLKSSCTARYYSLNPLGGDAKSRRTFGGIDNSEAATRPGSDVVKISAVLERVDDGIDRPSDLRQFSANGKRHALILAIQCLQNLKC
jgi:hypothetical protein